MTDKAVPRNPNYEIWEDADIRQAATITRADILDAIQDARQNYPDLAEMLDGAPTDRATTLTLTEQRIDDGLDTLEDFLIAVLIGGAALIGWQQAVSRELKLTYLQATAAGVGGWERLILSDYVLVANELIRQFRYFAGFVGEIARGELSEGEIRRRMAMYQNAARSAYFEGYRNAARRNGYTQERRLTSAAEHCEDCLSYAAQGWQPIGTLPKIGESQCLSNCKCRFEFQ